jgi:AcrR family transcriptional regulator
MKMRRSPDFAARPNGLPYAHIEHLFGARFGVAIETRYNEILRAAGEVFGRHGYHQASIREIARSAGLSLAGLYHYVGGKDELLFLTLDRALETLHAALRSALSTARTPELRLLALIRTHLDFGFQHPSELKIINRDWEQLAEPRRSEIAAKRGAYVQAGLAILRELDPHGRPGDELFSATNLLLGMLNGIARRPFLKSRDDARALAGTVGALFLYGFLERSAAGDAVPAAARGGEHDD